MENSKKGKGMKVAHYITTGLILAILVWLALAEMKRMKLAKELADSVVVVVPPDVTD